MFRCSSGGYDNARENTQASFGENTVNLLKLVKVDQFYCRNRIEHPVSFQRQQLFPFILCVELT
jgi:hypothetical protein